MKELFPLFAGPGRAEAQLFHTPGGIAALLGEMLCPRREDAEICASGIVRLGAEGLGRGTEDACLFDHLVLTPSYGRIGGNQWQENRIIQEGLSRLRPGGSCICVVSNGWLARRSADDVETRRLLVEEYRLTRLVLLPPHTFETEVKTSAFFLEKSPPEEAQGVFVTDLRQAGAGLALITALCQAEEADVCLTRAMLRAHDYALLPEAYAAPSRAEEERSTLAALEERIARIYREAEEGRRPEQFSLFAAAPAPPTRDPEMVRRLIDLEYQRLDLRFWAAGKGRDWPRLPGRALFTLKNGVECRETGRGEGYPLYTAAGFSGFAQTANVTGPVPTLVISRVGAYCGQVYRVWETCAVSTNAMYLSSVREGLPLDLLLFLLRGAGLNRLKRGSAQLYITQDVALEYTYPVPPEEEWAALIDPLQPDLDRIRALELELIAGSRR